jgi:hypothetical protein
MKSLYEAMLDEDLFGRTFAGKTFWAWRTIAKFMDALPLDAEELKLWQAVTGRDAAPTERFLECYGIKPRRAGGTLFLAALGLHAALSDYGDCGLGPGEVATVALIASDRKQARQLMNYVKGLIEDSVLIAPEATNITAETVTFKHRVNLEVHTTSWRSTRGYSYACVVLDELAFFRDDLSANPDVELIRALRPGLVNLNGRLLGFSSPHSRRGHLWEMYRQHYGKASRVLVIQAGGPTLNPTINPEFIARARAEDAIAARSEWDAEFREDVSQFLTDDVIEPALRPGRRALPCIRENRYVAFCDPSGGRSDAMTLGISHQEAGGRCVLDKLVIVKAPFNPEDVVIRFAETLSAYGLKRVTGDRYAAEWVASMFSKVGVSYEPSMKDKSAIYVETMPLFSQQLVDLLDVPQLETELRLLERKPRPGGRGDFVDHPPRAHDDVANAACGALWLASIQVSPGLESTPSVTHTRSDYNPLTRGEEREAHDGRPQRPLDNPGARIPIVYY